MKDYINLEALSCFLNNLWGKFAPIKHEHTQSDIDGLQDLMDKLDTMEQEVAALKSIINDNDILVVNENL